MRRCAHRWSSYISSASPLCSLAFASAAYTGSANFVSVPPASLLKRASNALASLSRFVIWIFNTDQGSTFTAEAFAGKLAAAGVAISMDGRGRFMDNIFIERLWRSIKYEEVHLKAYADGREARAGIGSWMTFYNFRRPHQAMNNQTPMAVWRAGMDKIEAAARAVDTASLGQRKRVAHIPTAEAEAARSGLIF